jgi:hypothetical protein
MRWFVLAWGGARSGNSLWTALISSTRRVRSQPYLPAISIADSIRTISDANASTWRSRRFCRDNGVRTILIDIIRHTYIIRK